MRWEATELGKSDGVRWAVGEQNGRRSSTYRFWGNKKGDFYLAARSIGGSLKSIRIRRAARAKSASIEISIPGASTPPT